MHTRTLALVLITATTTTAAADDGAPTRLSLKLEPDLGTAVDGPQRDAFGIGGGGFISAAYGPADWLDLQLTGGGLSFDPKMDDGGPGLFGAGGGVRLQFPQERNRVAPYVDGDALFVRTGGLNRVGFTASLGILFALDRPRTYWLGFHVRYLQVHQATSPGMTRRTRTCCSAASRHSSASGAAWSASATPIATA